jgi:hypothetical protein
MEPKMFVIEYQLDLGDMGYHESTIAGVVYKDEWGYGAEVKRATIDLDSKTIDITKFIKERTLLEVEDYLKTKYIAAEGSNELIPEDWSKEGA